MIRNLCQRIPSSLMGKTVTFLLLVLFFLLPFQKHLLHKTFKAFSKAAIPFNLVLPSYFSTKMAFFFSDVILIILLLRILYLKKGQCSEFFWSGPSKYLTLLFITALFSLGASSSSHYLLMYTRFIQIALVMVVFNSIKIAFDTKTLPAFLKLLAWLIFALSLFESAVALLQYFLQSSVGLRLLGEPNRVHFCFDMPYGYRTLLDALWAIQRPSEHLLRSTGTFPHPNVFGGFQFCALLTTFYLYFIQQTKKYKSLLLGGVFFQMLALTIIFSRSAVFALFPTTLFYFLLQARFPHKRAAILKLTLTLLLSSLFCLILFYPQLSARGGIINYNALVKGADSERLIYQNIALDMIKEHPWLGVGLNNFQIESPRFFPPDRILPFKVHNIYLLFAAETGLIGAGCFLIFLFSCMKNALVSLHSEETVFLLSLFAGLLFIGVCDFYFISTPHGRILFFGTAALLFTASYGLKTDEKVYIAA